MGCGNWGWRKVSRFEIQEWSCLLNAQPARIWHSKYVSELLHRTLHLIGPCVLCSQPFCSPPLSPLFLPLSWPRGASFVCLSIQPSRIPTALWPNPTGGGEERTQRMSQFMYMFPAQQTQSPTLMGGALELIIHKSIHFSSETDHMFVSWSPGN